MDQRYEDKTRSLTEAVLNSPGETDPAVRRAVEARAAALAGRPAQAGRPTEGTPEVPQALHSYIDKVPLHAYKTTDDDIQTLRTEGYSEDAIFELTLSAALGAGLARLERGLAALGGDK